MANSPLIAKAYELTIGSNEVEIGMYFRIGVLSALQGLSGPILEEVLDGIHG